MKGVKLDFSPILPWNTNLLYRREVVKKQAFLQSSTIQNLGKNHEVEERE